MTIPLVFLHGWAMNGAVFNDVAARLGAAFECHAPDLPGHGARAQDTPSLEHCVDVAQTLIGQLERPILIGWSMGAAIAWRYIARRGGAALRGLITIDMSPRLLPDADWPFGLLGQNAQAVLATSAKIEPQWRGMVGGILRNMYAQGSALAAQSEAMQAFLLAQNPAVLRPLWDDLVALDERQTIARIDIPYLVCAGAQSRLYTPDLAHWIAQRARCAQVQIFKNSGHSPHLEEPDAFCEAIRRFVAAECGAATPSQKTGTK